ncbi:MAG TPA: hypothetical protein VNN19_11035 [bacterium]|nr:hypothetical protein [bacterium]
MRTAAALIAAAITVASLAAPATAQAPPPPAPPAPAQPEQPAPAQPLRTPGPRRIVPGESLAGIQVGSRIATVVARFGGASQIIDTALDTVYVFSRFGITVYVKGGVVTAASATNSLLKINDAVGVGHRVEDVLAVFGRGYREGEVEGYPGLIYDRRGVAFGLDGRGVAVIIVFGPGTAAAISALNPGGAPAPTAAGFPRVAGLRPFSPETNFMSLPGYLRWIMYQATATWITYQEADRVVREQQGGG